MARYLCGLRSVQEKESERMQYSYTYHIEVQGQLEEKSFNALSPLRIKDVKVGPVATLFTLCADQSGLIGLIRYLHQQGFMLLSILRDR
jgi:hypothetical protein